MRHTKIKIWIAALLTVLLAWAAGAAAEDAPPGAPGSLNELFDTIRTQQSKFPVPEATQKITIGTIDLSQSSAVATLAYSIPTYEDGTMHVIGRRGPPPCDPVGRRAPDVDAFMPIFGSGPCLRPVRVFNVGGQLTIANIRHLTVAFAVTNWQGNGESITLRLGSKTQTVSSGATEIVFDEVSETNLPIILTVNGALTANGVPIPTVIPGLLPLSVTWQLTGAGVMTIPVLPVSIVYAPIVDPNKKNTASAALSRTTGNTTTLTLATQNGSTSPVPSSFQSTVDMAKDMSLAGQALSKVPNVYVAAVGTALTVIAAGMGSSTATQTNSTTVTKQNALALNATNTVTQTALASQGGPGVGDLISYYYNARVAWYSNGKAMRIAYLGSDGWVQATAGELASVRKKLATNPKGTVDPTRHVDLASVSALLKLDPFVDGGPSAVLPTDRFIPISNGVVEVFGGTVTFNASHQITTTETNTAVNTTTFVQSDKSGYLSFLGIGVSDDDTIQSQISQSSSAQASQGQTFTQLYTLNGEPNKYYGSEIYFDAVFGSFAFRDVTNVKDRSAVSGSLMDAHGVALARQKVSATAANKTYVTATDEQGRFSFRLPGVSASSVRLASGNAKASLTLADRPTENIVLRRN